MGIELVRDEIGMYLTQSKYIVDLLKRLDMGNVKPCSTLATIGKSLSASDGEAMTNRIIYISTISVFQYLTLMRPNIAYIVNKLS